MALQVAFLCLKNLGAKTWDQVAHWKQFGADGIDLDLETGAGDQPVSQMNDSFLNILGEDSSLFFLSNYTHSF